MYDRTTCTKIVTPLQCCGGQCIEIFTDGPGQRPLCVIGFHEHQLWCDAGRDELARAIADLGITGQAQA